MTNEKISHRTGPETSHTILRVEGIVKKFGELVANDYVDFNLRAGEIHCLLGENGAGKSTLMNIIYGLWQPDEGSIYVHDQKVVFKSPKDAINHKIGMVSQHFSLVPLLTVSENVVLVDIPSQHFFQIDKDITRNKVLDLAESCGFKLDPQVVVEDLSVGEQQHVEILKALYKGAEILVLDEPTSVLTSQETEELFKVLRAGKKHGRSTIFITHKLKEALLCDRITIMRSGKVICEMQANLTTEEELVEAMFGKKEQSVVHKEGASVVQKGHPLLELRDLSVRDERGVNALKDVSFHILEGEILGIAGLAGNGQTELCEAITGLRKAERGSIILKGEDITNFTPRLRRERGMAHIPEDRLKLGSLGDMAISDNLVLGRQHEVPFIYEYLLRYLPIMNYVEIKRFSEKTVAAYDVRPRDISKIVKHLSGGNLQKMLLARELAWEPEIIITAQPTRGLDIKTLEFIHEVLLKQKEKGKAVLLVSYDLDEIFRLSDRIGVIFEGEITFMPPGEVDRRKIERMMVSSARTT